MKNDSKQSSKMRPYPPLGTLYAASYLRRSGYSVALFDAMLAEGMEDFERLLENHAPRVVILYEDQFNFLNKMCLKHSREAACRMSSMARRRNCIVIAAGSDISDHPEVYFQHGVHFAIIGEAEHAIQELLDTITGRRAGLPERVQGVGVPDPIFPKGVRMNSARTPERHPDVFPFPAWDLLDVERYRSAWIAAHGYFSVNMVSTRGCPFHCNWCAKPIWGQRYAMRSPANVAEEMAIVKKDLKPDHVWFADDIFGLQPKWVVEFAHEVKSRDAKVPFTIQSRADLMTENAVQSLAQAGCAEVWLGAESGSQKILDAMDKGITVAQIWEARERLRSFGILACYFIQFGYPGEGFEDILSTVQLIRDTLPDDIGISVSNPLPGTKFYQMVKAELGEKDHWDESNDLDMMFQGTYQTAFYRKLHELVHRDLDLRRRSDAAIQIALRQIDDEWRDLRTQEASYRSTRPTSVRKCYTSLEAPDLSQRWN
jgi:anaerobic magnesium-protoporphyrin IX monomethyl ester cyclase